MDWYNALLDDRTITVTSSADLVDKIERRQHKRSRDLMAKGKPVSPMKRNLAPVQCFDPVKIIPLKPISLLHAVGLMTTPPVANPAALSIWAIIRYIWAFEVSNGSPHQPLALSTLARQIDFHQKGLLSDEIGIGMACHVMTNYFPATRAVDVSFALQTPSWNAFQQYRASPDYLFFDDRMASVYVVECKGNQTSCSAALDQLCRGTEQVPSIVFTDGRKTESIVIATCMLEHETIVYILDPVGNTYPTSDDGSSREIRRKAEKKGPTEWQIRDDDWFVAESRLVSRAKMLAYAGASSRALAQLPLEVQTHWEKHLREPEQKEISTNAGCFVGTTDTMTMPDGTKIELSRGILEDLQKSFYVPLRNEPERVERGREGISVPKWYADLFKEGAYRTEAKKSTDAVTVQSVCQDGTMLQISITDRDSG